MRNLCHIYKHRGLKSHCTEDMTRVWKAQWWHWGDTGIGCKDEAGAPASHAAIVFVLPLSPLSASQQLDLCAGLYDGQGRTAALEHLPCPRAQTQQNTPRTVPSSACLFFHQLALIRLWRGQSPAQICPSVGELSLSLFGCGQPRNSETQRRKTVTTYQYPSLLSSQQHASSPL